MANVAKKLRHLTNDEKSVIRRAFEFLDTDRDGYLDYHETKAAMRALGFDVKKSQVSAIMRAYDATDGNRIGFDDFYYIMADKVAKRDPLDELKYAYKLFSGDSVSGKITLTDLQRIDRTVGSNLTEDEMRAMIEEFDLDRDGCIDEAEFIEIMKSASD